MERYLTQKVRPSKAVLVLEKLALVTLFALLAAAVYAAASVVVYGFSGAGVSAKFLLLLVPAVLLVLAMNPIAERIRARRHAVLIVKSLLAADGIIPVDELEEACGVRRAGEVAQRLTERGYLQRVMIVQGNVCLEDKAQAMVPAEPVKPLFRDAEV